jgi:outer membrane receptor protein involved in Fe transport
MNGFQEINVMIERPRFRAVLLLCGVLFYPALVSAQAAAVVGNVQDQAGGALPGVSVELRPTSGSPLVTQTDAQGAFRLDGVPPGHYVATLTLANFLSVRRDVDVAASAPTRLDVTLRVSLNTAVVVTATRTERTLEEVPASVSVLNEAVIQATPAQSLDDVIRTMPGININSDASYQVHFTANGITMRGLGSGADTRTLVMLDGVPLNGPNQGVVQWMQVPLESIDQVELVRGGGSALWGNYALGGVMNIVTRPPAASEASGDVGYGRFGTSRLNAYGASAANRAFELSGNVNYFNTAGFNRVPEDQREPLDIPTTFDATNAQATARFTLNPTVRGFVRGSFFEGDQNLGTPQSTNHTRLATITGGVTQTSSGGSSLVLNGFYRGSRFQTDNPGAPDDAPRRTAEYVQNAHVGDWTDVGSSVQWNTSHSTHLPLISFGADVHRTSGSDTAAIFSESHTQIRTDVGRGTQLLTGVFGQASVVPAPDVEILANVRFEYFKNFDGFDGNPGGIGPVPDTTATATTGRMSVRYKLNPVFALRGAVYNGFRAPQLDDLYRGFSIPGGTFLPNSQLVPETLQGAEGGVDVSGRGARAQVTGFFNQVKDLITSRNLDQSELAPGFFFGTRNINAGKLHSSGAEAETTWAMSRSLSANVAYTYTHSQIVENPVDPSSVGQQLFGVPKNKASAMVAYAGPSGFKAAMRVRYQQAHAGDPGHTLVEPSYIVWDLSVAYRLSKHLEMFGNIENLFNLTYVASDNGFGPSQLGTPFSPFVGLRMRL